MGQIQQSVNNAMISFAVARTYADRSKSNGKKATEEVTKLQELKKDESVKRKFMTDKLNRAIAMNDPIIEQAKKQDELANKESFKVPQVEDKRDINKEIVDWAKEQSKPVDPHLYKDEPQQAPNPNAISEDYIGASSKKSKTYDLDTLQGGKPKEDLGELAKKLWDKEKQAPKPNAISEDFVGKSNMKGKQLDLDTLRNGKPSEDLKPLAEKIGGIING